MPAVRYSHAFLISWLRERLRQHNRQVLTFAAMSITGAVAGWAALYGVSHWLMLVAAVIIRGPYASVPAGFSWGFAAIAATLILSAWVDRKLTPNALPPDEKTPGEIGMDFLLAIPRMTLAIPANLSAWVRFTEAHLSAAAVLVDRLSGEQRIPVYEVPLEIPEQAVRERVLDALLLLGVIEFQREADSSIWLKVTPATRNALGGPALE